MAETKNIPEVHIQVRLDGVDEIKEELRELYDKLTAVKTLAGELTAALDELNLKLSRVERKAE